MYKTRKDELPEDVTGGRHGWWAITGDRGSATGGVIGFGELGANAGAGLHRHRNAEEAILVLGGSGVLLTPDGDRTIGEGTLLYARRGAWHGLRAGDQGLSIMMIYGGPTSPDDVDYDPAKEELEADAPIASSIHIWDAEEMEVHDPDQGFFHMAARWLVDDQHLGSAGIVVGQSSFEPGRGTHALHRHPGAEEFLYVLSGNGVHIDAQGEEVEVAPGDITFVARNEWHGFRNTGETTALAIFGYLGVPSLAAGGYELPDSDES